MEMSMKKFKTNLNHNVWVTLNEKGRQALIKHWTIDGFYGAGWTNDALDHCHPGWRENNTPVRMQLWQAMQYFGPGMRMGSGEHQIETEIEIEVYDDKDEK